MTIENELKQYIRQRAKASEEALDRLGCKRGTPDFVYMEVLWTKQFYQQKVEELSPRNQRYYTISIFDNEANDESRGSIMGRLKNHSVNTRSYFWMEDPCDIGDLEDDIFSFSKRNPHVVIEIFYNEPDDEMCYRFFKNGMVQYCPAKFDGYDQDKLKNRGEE